MPPNPPRKAEGAEAGANSQPSVWSTTAPATPPPPPNYVQTNKVVTSKYNIVTFLPIFLFEMFSRVAYLYFLIQAGLCWWSVVSPYSGIGSTLALLFVLLVAGIKAVWEDMKRHQEDQRMNTSITHRLNPDGSVQDIPWTDVRVGDAIVVRDDENFPADLLCLYSALADNVCFIRTTNLDGETNLKIRKPLDVKGLELNTKEDITGLDLTLKAEPPNKNLHKFKGSAEIRSKLFAEMLTTSPSTSSSLGGGMAGAMRGQVPKVLSTLNEDGEVSSAAAPNGATSGTSPSGTTGPTSIVVDRGDAVRIPSVDVAVTMNEMLLRGCTLKNSNEIVGLVVYTGKETRIQMNSTKTPLKIGSFDRFLNLQITLVIAMQLAMCIFLAVANYIWVQNSGVNHPYLALNVYVEGIYSNGFVQILINFLTFWILLSYLVPISLFVTLEIVKFWQGFIFMNLDKDMKDPVTGEYARCRNSNLNEDLGKVEYVFSDKTGTLTSNEMQLRQVSIKGQILGSSGFRLEDHPTLQGLAALRRFDGRLSRAARAVQQSTAWNALVVGGGSDRRVMAYHHSNPSHGTAETLGLPYRQVNLDDFDAAQAVEEEQQKQQQQQQEGLGRLSTVASGSTMMINNDGGSSGEVASGGFDTLSLSPTPSLSLSPSPTAPSPLTQIESPRATARSAVALGHHMVDFFTNICLCHSLILEEDPSGGQPRYQGPSPDEVALVEAARQMGFEFKNRAQTNVTLSMLGREVTYEILNVMEYSSERGCMSVIARSPDGTVRLYCKGADTKVMKKIRGNTDAELVSRTDSDLHTFAKSGLRTLVLASKVIPEETYNDWDVRYQEASRMFEGRDAAMDELGNEIENDLELIGVTAIEDKLQDGVPEAIKTLLDANIRVWMITGDKQETAVNIAVSCDLVQNPDDVMMVNVDEKSEDASQHAEQLLADAMATLCRRYSSLTGQDVKNIEGVPDTWREGELAVDGPTLNFIMASPIMSRQLAQLAARCSGVVVSRSSPSQKAAIVRNMAEYEMDKAAGSARGLLRWYRRYRQRLRGKMLSIGDGANDVAMLQTADVGVGIMGKEGRQAVNNSDYAFSQFRFLVPLLLVHGTLSYYRLSRLIKYSFYKNICFAFIMFYFQFYNGYSGQALVDSITAAVFNVVFTSLPILLFAVLDRPVGEFHAFIRYPQLYDKRNSHSLSTISFWKSGVLQGILHGAVCFFIPYYIITTSGNHNITDVYSIGRVTFMALLGCVTLEVALVARYWTWVFFWITLLSYLLMYPYMLVFPWLELAFNYYDPANFGVSSEVMSNATTWFGILVCYIITFGSRYAERTYQWVFRPHDTMILREKEAVLEAAGGNLMSEVSGPSRRRLVALGTLESNKKKKKKKNEGAAGQSGGVGVGGGGTSGNGQQRVSNKAVGPYAVVEMSASKVGRQQTSSDSASLPSVASARGAGAGAGGAVQEGVGDSVKVWDYALKGNGVPAENRLPPPV